MCLITLAWQVHPRFPLLLAGNRDEFHARAAAPLEFDASTAIAGGRDLEAGGRWLGLSAAGRLAAVTNVRRGLAPAPGLRSRGELVEDFLGQLAGPTEVLDALRGRAADYAGFNLLLADRTTLGYAGTANGWHTGEVAPGLHSLSNASLDTDWPKTRALRAQLERGLSQLGSEPGPEFVEPLLAALCARQPAADAELPDTGIGLERERALSAAFVALGPYGTRCSSLVLQRDDGRWWFIEQRYAADGAVSGRSLLEGDAGGLLRRA